jgi:sugar (pentulose or hexulose) kinase
MTMAEIRYVAVIDIGKSNAKLALVDLDTLAEISVRKAPNTPRTDGRYPQHDVDAIWGFILDGLTWLRSEHPVDAISVTTHGATAALVKASGALALPVLDYEYTGPDDLRAEYDRVRPPFAETGSPALPIGLNLGAQLFWQSRTFPDAFAGAASILMYPQYWAFRLTGVTANEVTSLGCHTDLWNPGAGEYSALVDEMGWRELFAPLRPARARLGTILPDIAERTGLDPATPVFCGIHDSNASLLPHLLTRQAPFAVVSTGTWVICMAVGGRKVDLDPARDTVINVNSFGDPVPSARFMGGREYELLTGGNAASPTEDDITAVLTAGIMVLPSVQQGSGPFTDRASRWIGRGPSPGERMVAASFYLAMMTATCLDLAGADGEIVVEGPFSGNRLFLEMLATATGRSVLAQTGQATGTSIGAALLARTPGSLRSAGQPVRSGTDGSWREYADAWREAAQAS